MKPPQSGLKHNPFAALRGAAAATPAKASQATPSPSAKPPLGRVFVREEHDEAEAAMITRVLGLPPAYLQTFGKQWRDILGETVAIEGKDLLVMAQESERVAKLLRDAGASEVVVVQRPTPVDLSQTGAEGGTVRAEVRRGMRVAIVQKADQQSGKLTEGIVKDLLTSAPTHPRGIKVRLESGEIGRVRRLIER